MFIARVLSRRLQRVSLAAALSAASLSAAEVIHQEGFNTDGDPARYTMTGRDVYEVPRIQSEIGNYDQKGPIYWAHNFDVSYVGNPNIPARRMILTWRSDPLGGAATEDLLALFDSSVNWLLDGKANATIVVTPDSTAINELADRLRAAGHDVVDDDATILDEQDVPGDLFIHAAAATNPSRFALVSKPVMVINALDYDDMLVGSIGTQVTFDPGEVTIAAEGHPAAGGKTGSFTGFNSLQQPFELTGSVIAPGATTLATVTRVVSPSVANLADVDAAIAGTKQHEEASGMVTDIDLADASSGNWFSDFPIPGDYTGNWGLRVLATITVNTAGTYRFALGSDDGARLLIDRDRNGLSDTDSVLNDPGPHAHQIVYADVEFTASGDYEIEVRSYNSAGGGSLEVSVSNVPAPVPDDALDSGYWEVLSVNGVSEIKLKNDAAVTSYRATGEDVEVDLPLIVLLNGPTDTPPGSFYDGGPFTGFEGAGFIGASGLNKWAYPDGLTYRALQLQPVDVSGKTNVKLTIALAATVVDFEDSDFLDIYVYTNGVSDTPVRLAHFKGVANAVQPWLADEMENYTRRLTRQFADFTYDIPPEATSLVVEIRAATTWWTEIAAFDNIRITAGNGGGGGEPTLSLARDGSNVVITFANGSLQRTTSLATPIQWQNVNATGGTFTIAPAQQVANEFFRVVQ